MIKKFYESYLIIDGNLEDAAIDEEIKKFESLLLKNEVEIIKIDRIGRKRLAYPIKNNSNGFYICFEILSLPDLIKKIERAYKLDENILRYLTIYISSKTRKEKDEHLKNRAIIQAKYEESKEQLSKAVSESAEVIEPDKELKEPKVTAEKKVTENI